MDNTIDQTKAQEIDDEQQDRFRNKRQSALTMAGSQMGTASGSIEDHPADKHHLHFEMRKLSAMVPGTGIGSPARLD